MSIEVKYVVRCDGRPYDGSDEQCTRRFNASQADSADDALLQAGRFGEWKHVPSNQPELPSRDLCSRCAMLGA